MGNRTIERKAARRLYDEFSRKWRSERRLAGKVGQPGFRKPTFRQWHEIHLRDHAMMQASTPADVQEYLGQDPWQDMNPPTSDRGVLTVPISGDDE